MQKCASYNRSGSCCGNALCCLDRQPWTFRHGWCAPCSPDQLVSGRETLATYCCCYRISFHLPSHAVLPFGNSRSQPEYTLSPYSSCHCTSGSTLPSDEQQSIATGVFRWARVVGEVPKSTPHRMKQVQTHLYSAEVFCSQAPPCCQTRVTYVHEELVEGPPPTRLSYKPERKGCGRNPAYCTDCEQPVQVYSISSCTKAQSHRTAWQVYLPQSLHRAVSR